ncbi:MAG TPA: TerB family tellurite resistance protein [Polyangiaceae bacterium]|nr:TerB family tellurite resistance protein [Polyangiaceae bacterium]
MIWLSNSTLARLRDQLRERGQRPSLVLPNMQKLSPDAAALLATTTEYGPLCEAMYLMMSADGHITNNERDVLKGALRNLSDDAVPSAHIEAMLDAASRSVAEFGRDARLAEVVDQLRDDPARAEVAFVLAAAIAFADNAIADEENETLSRFAEGLGIDEGRADTLLDGVEADLRGKR